MAKCINKKNKNELMLGSVEVGESFGMQTES